MKTFEQALHKAITIADADPNARVAIFDLRILQKLSNNIGVFTNGKFKSVQKRYESDSGGWVMFFDAGQEVWPNCAAYQFTHVFCSDHVSRDDKLYLKSRIRSANTVSPEPMGFYDYDGVVHRYEAW